MTAPLYFETSKSKLWLYFFGSLGFVAAGLWLLLAPETFRNSSLGSESIVMVFGAISTVFFGTCGVVIARKLGQSASGIVIDDRGIVLNEHGPDVGLIEWEDIQNCRTYRPAGSPRMLVLLTDRPEKYIARAKSKLARKTMEVNGSFVGSPLWVNTDTLRAGHDEVAQIILDRIAARQTV